MEFAYNEQLENARNPQDFVKVEVWMTPLGAAAIGAAVCSSCEMNKACVIAASRDGNDALENKFHDSMTSMCNVKSAILAAFDPNVANEEVNAAFDALVTDPNPILDELRSAAAFRKQLMGMLSGDVSLPSFLDLDDVEDEDPFFDDDDVLLEV